MFMKRNIRPLVATIALLGATGIVACGDSIGQGSDFVKDSWSRPTDHGVLDFAAGNPAEFTAEERFHAWTFELSGDADVVVETNLITQNLDSEMYLYKKKADGNWGAYIAKNDDVDDLGLGSRVKRSLDAGEYQVKVKAGKSLMTGHFTVKGACSGDGCPAIDNFCGPDDAALPAATGYSKSCAEKMHKILTTPIGLSAPTCLADNLEERAVDYYKSYWDDIYSYEEMSEGEEPGVGVTHHSGAGTVIRVDLGGDEDAMDYVFDAEGKLLFSYQHNQSPDWSWYCEGPVDENVDPGDECATQVAGNDDYRIEDVDSAEGEVALSDADSLLPQVAAAVKEFAAESNLSSDASVSYAYSAWKSGYSEGADVTLNAAGASEIGYTVTGDTQWGMTITFRTTAEGTDFLCKEL